MKKTAYLLFAVVVLLCAAPAFAQGPFTDVPTDHWAYDAVNTLQKDGILIGYPDGTFNGKRMITRYEFATAIARILPLIQPGLSKAEIENMLSNYVQKSQLPAGVDLSNVATKSDVEAIRKLVDEFRDELASMGVDIDALKRDVAALTTRVEALEAEVRRVKITGEFNTFAVATSSNQGTVVDIDERNAATSPNQATLLKNLKVIRDFDLNIVGRVNETTTANAKINYGNYLNYLGAVDDYAGIAGNTSPDTFFPYYMYVDSGLGKGNIVAGRLPIQFTPYTLKKIDVDSYTNILKTDDGNYPIDGAKIAYNFGGVDLTLFGAKNDSNAFLANGLTGQPTIGLFNQNLFVPGTVQRAYRFHQLGGHAIGGLNQITQSAGARIGFGLPWNIKVGATYYQGWDRTALAANYDQARVFGADLTVPIPLVPSLGFAGSWTRSDTLARVPGVSDIDNDNVAWDGKLNVSFGSLAVGAGYKDIGRNFSAAGYWDAIGRWTNPTDIKGPYADFTFPILENVKFAVNGEYLRMKETVATSPTTMFGSKGDHIAKAEGIVSWGFTKSDALDLAYNWVRYNPNTAGLAGATETYATIGLAHEMSPNAKIKVGYQLIKYNNGPTASGPYGSDYHGGQGVVQFGVSF